ncbi:MAG TPA: class I SAM-dependent methyltransferase [Solirubrobacterales bacterium]
MTREAGATRPIDVIWQDVECGAYAADLKLWEELADQAHGRILDLGCGIGRVALHLARRGHSVTGLDSDSALLAAFSERIGELPADGALGDARQFELEAEFELTLGPMQLVQLFADKGERVACMRCVAAHLRPGGLAAFAIVEEMPDSEAGAAPLPDVREIDGWVYSSLPLDATIDAGSIVVRRLRQIVSPTGELEEEGNEIRLSTLAAEELEREAGEAGLRAAGRRAIPPTEDHVGSTVVLLEAP